jgi:tetratricopeptide (TPR) repeat protein
MADIAKHLAESYPERSDNWMHWAYALREMDQIEEAKSVAIRSLELHPDEAVLHYNLACYLSLLGEFEPAKKHLNRACVTDDPFKAFATEDVDLAGPSARRGHPAFSSRCPIRLPGLPPPTCPAPSSCQIN